MPAIRVRLQDLHLAIGSASQSVTVQAAAQMIPMTTGSRSDVLSYKDITNVALEGRDVTEMLKVLPGVVQTPNGLSNGASFNALTVTAQTSSVGNGLNVSGAEYRGPQQLLSDGVNVIDPGDMGGSIGTINPDMVQEMTVLTSNFGADQEFGPVVISTISKSGTDHYHGEAYFDARNDVLNANDWQSNHQGKPKGGASYYYPGGNIGGYVPKTHKKLFFWGGYERWLQNQGNANVLQSYIPSPEMMAGDFTNDNADNRALCPNGFGPTQTGWCNDLSKTVYSDGTAAADSTALPGYHRNQRRNGTELDNGAIGSGPVYFALVDGLVLVLAQGERRIRDRPRLLAATTTTSPSSITSMAGYGAPASTGTRATRPSSTSPTSRNTVLRSIRGTALTSTGLLATPCRIRVVACISTPTPRPLPVTSSMCSMPRPQMS